MKATDTIIRIFVPITLITSLAISREDTYSKKSSQTLEKRLDDPSGPTQSIMNINNIVLSVRRDGFFPWNGTATGTAGQ